MRERSFLSFLALTRFNSYLTIHPTGNTYEEGQPKKEAISLFNALKKEKGFPDGKRSNIRTQTCSFISLLMSHGAMAERFFIIDGFPGV